MLFYYRKILINFFFQNFFCTFYDKFDTSYVKKIFGLPRKKLQVISKNSFSNDINCPWKK